MPTCAAPIGPCSLADRGRLARREHNGQADALANEAMDTRSSHLLQDVEVMRRSRLHRSLPLRWPGPASASAAARACQAACRRVPACSARWLCCPAAAAGVSLRTSAGRAVAGARGPAGRSRRTCHPHAHRPRPGLGRRRGPVRRGGGFTSPGAGRHAQGRLPPQLPLQAAGWPRRCGATPGGQARGSSRGLAATPAACQGPQAQGQGARGSCGGCSGDGRLPVSQRRRPQAQEDPSHEQGRCWSHPRL